MSENAEHGRHLGQEICNEMSRLGNKGQLFSYQQLQRLKSIETPEELGQFLQSAGIDEVTPSDSAPFVARQLSLCVQRRQEQWQYTIISLDIILVVLGGLVCLGGWL